MRKLASIIASILYAAHAYAFEPFKVKDIRLEGLQRISIGTVFNYLPIKVGDEVDENDTSRAIHALYKTGFFKDVRLEKEGDVLIVFVAERPAIAEIHIHGNDKIPTDKLKSALKDLGLSQGRVFDQSILDEVNQQLRREYYSLGKYGVKITTKAKPLPRNRVAITINIAEGKDAEVYQVNVIGNKTFSNKTLLDQMTLPDVGLFGGRENYSRQVLAGDLEALRSYYMDRGYIKFSIDSTQVQLTPDKQDVYVSINITEGNVYTVREVKVVGNKIIKPDELKKLITIHKGELFSRKKTTATRKNISDRLAQLGYPFANVNIAPDIDNDSKTVALTVYIDPGRRVYVRRINITGNKKTRDDVVRRELRQYEGDWLSTKKVALSQVDLDVDVKERSTGSLSFGVGYSDVQGAIINFSLSQDNFFGSGKRVSITADNSSVTRTYAFSVLDPYFTDSGVSQNFSILSRKVDAAQASISNYVTNTKAVNLSYGIPLSELTRMNFGGGVNETEIVINSAWNYDSRDKAIFPTAGALTTVSMEAAVPGSDLEFYKLGFNYHQWFPLSENYTLTYRLGMDYGKAYGKTTDLPPFERYFAGGSQSVRGYDTNSLGNIATTRDSNGDPLGGDRRLLTSLELVLPNPFSSKSKELRLSTFIDGGYIWAKGDKLDLGEVRYSAGVSLIWIAPVGILRFSYAKPLNAKPTDRLKAFQFTLGSTF
ncbi:MAG: outer membrane protein assembly factor BamA [Gammaproteobacteria bacterium]